MSIRPDIERWKQRFILCLMVALGGMLFTGAKAAHQELRVRPARIQQVTAEWKTLVAAIADEVSPDASYACSNSVTDIGAMMVIQACSRNSVRGQ